MAPSQTDHDLTQEQELVSKARHDPECFGQLYELYYDRIYSFIAKRTTGRAQCEDLTALVFEKALRGLHSYRWRKGPFGAWLFKITRYTLIDHYRQDSKKREINLEKTNWLIDNSDGPFEHALQQDRARQIKRAFLKINKRYQEVLTYRFIDQLSNEEIAALTNQKKNVIAVLVHRALKALETCLLSTEVLS